MTEHDYILCTTLAKVRCITSLLAGVVPFDGLGMKDSKFHGLCAELWEWQEHLEQLVEAAQDSETSEDKIP